MIFLCCQLKPGSLDSDGWLRGERRAYLNKVITSPASLHLRHSSFSNPSFASPMSQDFHLCHLARRPWPRLEEYVKWNENVSLVSVWHNDGSTPEKKTLKIYHILEELNYGIFRIYAKV